MEQEGPEIGLDKLYDTGTAGQPIVQEENSTKEEEDTVEKDFQEKKDPVGEKEPARVKENTRQREYHKDPERSEEKDPDEAKEPTEVNESCRVKENPPGEKEHRKDMGRTEEEDPAKENESGRVNEDSPGEKECRKDTGRTEEEDPAGEKRSEEEHHAGSHPGIVPDIVPGIDQPVPGATVPPGGTGKKKRIRKKPVEPPRPVTEVHRKTEIFGMSAKPGPEDPVKVRRRTERNLKAEFGLPYSAAEKALQDLACSLVERQDRVNAGIALDIHIMQEDIGILQDQVYKLKTTKGGAAAAAGEKK